ncbi:MAG: hypothetical protein WB987_06365 [Candidatus Acidiferrales bacterium]
MRRARLKLFTRSTPWRSAIEHDFLLRASPASIVREYKLPHHSVIYRHVHAVGLAARREANLASALELLMEQAENAVVNCSTLVRAAQVYSRFEDPGR